MKIIRKQSFNTIRICAVIALISLGLMGATQITPILNMLPQGAMQGDFNGGNYSLTNFAKVQSTNFVGNAANLTNFTFVPAFAGTATNVSGAFSGTINGGNFSLTNVASVSSTNFIGNGANLTGVTAAAPYSVALATNAISSTNLVAINSLGGIPYGGAAGAITQLTGPTGTNTYLLEETGTGSAATAPAFQNTPAINGTNFYNLNGAAIGYGTVATNNLPITSSTGFGIAKVDNASILATSGVLSAPLLANSASANTFLRGPTSGGGATPNFGPLVSADIPNNGANTTGTASTATTANALSSTATIGNGATATTQTTGDTTSKVATDQFVANTVSGLGGGVTPLIGETRNLVGSAPGSAKTASWSCDQIVAFTSLTGTPVAYSGYLLGTGTLAFNGATTGAGGMDTGSTPTSGTLYIYAIYRPSVGWSTLGTITAFSNTPNYYGGSNMPTGYTASCLIWCGVTDGSGNIQTFNQQDRCVSISNVNVLNATGTTPTTYTAISLSTYIPVWAKTVYGTAGAPSALPVAFTIASGTSGINEIVFVLQNITNVDYTFSSTQTYTMPIITSQTIYYRSASSSSAPVRVNVSGYTF